MRSERQPKHPGRVSVTLPVDGDLWTVEFLEISRLHDAWLIECEVESPRRRRTVVTIRAAADPHAGATAQRVLGALRAWVLSGDRRDHALLELPRALQEAS